MDWSKVEKQHIDAAIKKYIEERPAYSEPYSYYLIHEGQKLPSKYIRGLAYSIATGEELNLAGYSGGADTVDFFKKHGFTVEQITDDTYAKYGVNDAVWIATALMAAEKYHANNKVVRDDMYFKQSDIVHRAQTLTKNTVDAARVSWWVNADNEKAAKNYLRSDQQGNPSSRRLSMMDEFPEKTYPLGLAGEDEVNMNGQPYKVGALLDFVRNVYPEVMKKMQKIGIDYLGVLNYLENNQEIPYSNPEAPGIAPSEKERLLSVKQKGQTAVAEMKKMASRCEALYGLDKCMPISWLDGSNTKTRKYLWAQMKYKDYTDNPASISLFVEKNSDATRYRISLEIKNDGANKAMMAKYHSHLDIPIQDGMAYVSGSNEWGNPEIVTATTDEIKAQIDSGALRKVQLCIYVEPAVGKTNEQLDAEITDAVKRLIPYYEHVIGETSCTEDGRAWLLTWNPASWNWLNYKAWCIDTKAGNKHSEPWTCSSKQPQIGDEVFLIKTGKKPRGILAHGYVVKEAYSAEHYEPEKAAQGIKSNHIDAEFDWIQDYETESILMQDDLKTKLPDQQWSPMGSGIEIKEPALSELRKMWEDLITSKDVYWPSYEEYPVDLTKDDWKRFLEDVEYPEHMGCMRVLKCFLDMNGIASPKQLSENYGGHPTVYTSSVCNTSRRALQYFNMSPCPDGDVKRYFPIAFLGHMDRNDSNETYVYKMRDELKEALQEMSLDSIELAYEKNAQDNAKAFAKNMILYGPPGTGKTYSTAIYAVAICDKIDLDKVKEMNYAEVMARYRDLVAAGRVAFTTFHQSYGYEEFIEGIKPVLNGGESIGYTIEDGVFKAFCQEATIPDGYDVDHNAKIWKVVLKSGDLTHQNMVKLECFNTGKIMYDWKTPQEHVGKYVYNQISHFQERVNIGDIVVTYAGEGTNIDAVGIVTGDAVYDEAKPNYRWSRTVKWIETNTVRNISHLNAGKYFDNDALQQLKRVSIPELLNEIGPKTLTADSKNYVFVIDEINRGNISKIFGELITLIEDAKRAGTDEEASAVLPYSGDTFSVPSNVYILGTMNTADRSIALMDTALRRRFQFVEMMPDANVLRSIGADKVEDLDVAAMLEKINDRITFLYDREHTIGHAFFTRLAQSPDVETLQSIFEKSVIPLLQEYFYEDYQKIQLVLGDNGKSDPNTKFIVDEEVKVTSIFKGNADDVIDLPEKRYSINKAAFANLESYKQII